MGKFTGEPALQNTDCIHALSICSPSAPLGAALICRRRSGGAPSPFSPVPAQQEKDGTYAAQMSWYVKKSFINRLAMIEPNSFARMAGSILQAACARHKAWQGTSGEQGGCATRPRHDDRSPMESRPVNEKRAFSHSIRFLTCRRFNIGITRSSIRGLLRRHHSLSHDTSPLPQPCGAIPFIVSATLRKSPAKLSFGQHSDETTPQNTRTMTHSSKRSRPVQH
jgi:hypothetical protein